MSASTVGGDLIMMRRCRFNCKLLTANILSLASHDHDLQNKVFSMTSEIVSEPINSSGMCLYSHKTKIESIFPKDLHPAGSLSATTAIAI